MCIRDRPYNVVENPAITDGSACLVIKDSYGNALIPFLVDHYQYLYLSLIHIYYLTGRGARVRD